MTMTYNSRTVNVSRAKLLDTLRTNREEHLAEFKQAYLDYHRDISVQAGEFKKHLDTAARIRNDLPALMAEIQKVRLKFAEAPVSHETEYNEAIAMLEFSVDETIKLDEVLFRQYVLNQWNWTAQFKALAGSYNNKRP